MRQVAKNDAARQAGPADPADPADSEGRALPAVGLEKKKAILLTPGGWAEKCGHMVMARSLAGKSHPACSAAHAAADALHGWSAHLYHSGEPMVMSEADYVAAIEAASAPVGRHYVPAPGARSKHAPPLAEG